MVPNHSPLADRFFDAFISYGRLDSKAFAESLNQRLSQAGLEVWFDFEDIPLAVDYQNQIDDGIEHAHNFLFVISPHSVNSPYCRKELELAIATGKRIIPLMHVEKISRDTWQQRNPQGTDEEWATYIERGLHDSFTHMHPLICKLNWVFFRDEDDFDISIANLLTLFESQKDYVHHHTWLLTQALHWQRHQQHPRLLLVGDDRLQAEEWLRTEFCHEQPPCPPTDLQCEYISESTKNANNLMTDLFLAYADEDRAVMQAIRSLLWRAGLTVWTDKTDIASGETFQNAIDRGIERASTVVYLVSPDALASSYCQHELDYALALHKRVVPVLIRPTDPLQMPEALRELHYIDWTANRADRLEASIAPPNSLQLLKILHQDAAYHEAHKQILVKALKWERQHRNPSILLRGYNLRHSEAWLQVAHRRSQYGPTPLHITFIEESLRQPPATALDVFISYSRKDSGLARQINDALQLQGKTTWFDQESIAAGSVDFQQEIYRGIDVSDNFLFILSSTAITSPYCADEVDYATRLNKRIVTILAQPIDTTQLHPALAKVQWLDFCDGQANFNAHFTQLIRTLDTDRDHVRSHTKWSQRSLEWQEQERTDDLLLRGSELAIAQSWLHEAQTLGKRPAPTSLQQDFITASQALSDRLQQEAEAQRQRELEQAQALAQAEAEARQQAEQRAEQEARARRISQRITLLTAIGAPLLSVLVLTTGVAWRTSQINEIESLTIEAEAHLRDRQPFDALVSSTRAGIRLRDLWLFAPRSMQSQIDGLLRQAAQDVRERNRLDANSPVWDVDLSPDEQHLAVALQDGTVQLWDMATQQLETSFRVSEGSVIQTHIAVDGQSLITVAEGQPVQQWDFTGTQIRSFGHPNETIIRAGLSPDGQWVITGSAEGTVQLWTSTGQAVRQFRVGDVAVTDVSISPDGRYLLAASENGVVHLWSLSGEEHQQLRHDDTVLTASFSPDSRSVITASWDYTLRQWDLQGKEQRRLDLEHYVVDIDVAADTQTLALAYLDGSVATWHLNDPAPVVLMGHNDIVHQVQISADGQRLVSGSGDRTVRLWDLATSRSPTLVTPRDAFIKDVRMDRQGGYVLAQHPDGSVKLWTTVGRLVASLDPGGEVRGAAFSPIEDMLATGTAEGRVTLWDLEGRLIRSFMAHGNEVTGLQFSPDGQYLATASADQTAALWDLQGNAQGTFSGHTEWVNHVSFSHDSQMVATTSTDQTARIWTRSGTTKHELSNHQDMVLKSAFSADSRLLATTSEDRTVMLWDVETGDLVGHLVGHLGAVHDVLFLPETDLIVTASDDGTARLWTLKGEERSRYQHDDAAILLVKISADGQFVATIADDGTARLWRIDSFDTLLAQACQHLQPYLVQHSAVLQGDRRRCDRLTRFRKI